MLQNSIQIKRALLSVSDKTEIIPLASELTAAGVEIISTGGTKKALEQAGIAVTSIESVTGNPEAFGGRMKTISFQVESALLYRRGHSEDERDAEQLNINPIDLVICNLYPFADAVKKGADEEGLVENIDIGGPTMIRAAAKNYESVCVLTSPLDYALFLSEFKQNEGRLSFEVRRKMALKAFAHTADYDAMISNELHARFADSFDVCHLSSTTKKELRYGENSHQPAGYFSVGSNCGVGDAPVLQGKALSYNNLLDADTAWKCNSDIFSLSGDTVAVTVVKHLNPCGVATGQSPLQALELAWSCDPVSAFGGILAFSHAVDKDVVGWLSDKFIEIIIAPDFTTDARTLLSKKKNLRVLELAPKKAIMGERCLRSIYGGVLVQNEDEGVDPEFRSVTKKTFPQDKEQLAQFGVIVNKYYKSNSVALVAQTEQGDYFVHGAGMGQPNRIDALKLLAAPRARARSEYKLADSILISDAFFPFRDSIDVCHAEGITMVVQPGGSIRDEEVIAACDEHGMAMAFTGRRHFRH